MMRHSLLAFVLVKIKIDERDHFLFVKHPKWGDWSLVGGHVEPGEEQHWDRTAMREADEELSPLRSGLDFTLIELLRESVSWGPVQSRSAGGHPTRYSARYFALHFLHDPVDLLPRLSREDFIFVPEAHLEEGKWEEDIADTLLQLARVMPEGLSAVPPAWPRALQRDEVFVQVRPFDRERRRARKAPSVERSDDAIAPFAGAQLRLSRR
jgi:8-oxo-dGTP pyrophosphatase MutT (NUDIX family)